MGDEEKKTPTSLETSMESGREEKTTTNDEPEVKYGGIKAMPFVIGNETFEKLGTIGSLTNLTVYLTTVFNMKAVTATTFLNVFSGTTNLAPLLGAYLTDTYFGRYKTLGFASISSFLVILCFFITRLLNYSGKKKKGKRCCSAMKRVKGVDASVDPAKAQG